MLPPQRPRVPNEALRAHRKQRGWSLDDVARELIELGGQVEEKNLGVSGANIGRWERGETQPRSPYPKLICMLYRASAEELGLYRPPSACARLPDDLTRSEAEEVRRREALRLLWGTAGAAVLQGATPPLGRAAALALPPEDPLAVEAIMSILNRYRGLWATIPSRELLGPALAHLQLVIHRLDLANSREAQAKFAAAATQTASFAGWLCYDMADYAAAHLHHQTAIACAERADEDLLFVYAGGCASLAARAASNGSEALVLIKQAKSRLSRDVPAAVRVWADFVEGGAHAAVQDVSGALAALGRAEDAAGRMRMAGEPSWLWLFPFDEGQIARFRGACATRLELPEMALPALHRASEALGPAPTKTRPGILSGLAENYLLTGEIEEACRLAGEAFAIAAQMDYERGLQLVRKVRMRLGPWRDTRAVRELDGYLLDAFLPPPDRA